MHKSTNNSQSGFTLIEVLATLVVIGFGLVSLAKLQGVTLQSSSGSKTRTAAAHLAEQKIEDLRNFTVLTPLAGAVDYQSIANNAGGALPSGDLNVADANVQYNRSWTVTDWYYAGTNAAPSNTIPTSGRPPDFKKITVTVSWQDSDGQNQSVILNTLISSADPARSGRILLTGF